MMESPRGIHRTAAVCARAGARSEKATIPRNTEKAILIVFGIRGNVGVGREPDSGEGRKQILIININFWQRRRVYPVNPLLFVARNNPLQQSATSSRLRI